MQNSCLKTSAWWSRGSHFVENGYLSLSFPNMVKVNIHEHWTRVTRFDPLWVSGHTVTQHYMEIALHDQSANCQPYCSPSWTSHHRPSKTHSSARCRLPGENVTGLHSVWLPVKGLILQLRYKIALKILSFSWTCFFGLKDKNNVFHLVFHLLLGRSKYK